MPPVLDADLFHPAPGGRSIVSAEVKQFIDGLVHGNYPLDGRKQFSLPSSPEAYKLKPWCGDLVIRITYLFDFQSIL